MAKRKTTGARRLGPPGTGKQRQITKKFAEEHHMRVVPLECGKGTKRPKWWDNAFDRSRMVDPLFRGKNVGLATGYGDVVDIDFDDKKSRSRRLAKLMFAEITASFGRGGKVTHRLYKSTGELKTKKFQHSTYGMLLEIRGNGAQTMAPGSIHPDTNELIEWFDHKHLARISYRSLIERGSHYAAGCVLLRHWNRGVRHDLAAALQGALIRSTSWSDSKIDTYVEQLAKAASDREKRHNAAYERRRIADDKPSYGKKNLKEILSKDYAKVAEWLAFDERLSNSDWDISDAFFTFSEFNMKDIPPIEWAINEFLAESSITMVQAGTGIGKTHFLIDLAVALTTGRDFMHWTPRRKYKVLFIDTEMAPARIRDRLNQWFPNVTDNLVVMNHAFYKDVAGEKLGIDVDVHQSKVLEAIQRFGTEFLIIDPLKPALSVADENASHDAPLYMDFLVDLRSEGVSTVFSHHAGKDLRKGDRGTSARRDLCESVINLRDQRRGQAASFSVSWDKVRDVRPVPEGFKVTLATNSDGKFIWQFDEGRKQDNYLLLLSQEAGISNVDAAEQFTVSERTIRAWDGKFRKAGFIEGERKSRSITPAGIQYLRDNGLWPDEPE